MHGDAPERARRCCILKRGVRDHALCYQAGFKEAANGGVKDTLPKSLKRRGF